MSELNSTRLKEFLKYNPDTGVFIWEQNIGRRVKSGQKAGCLHPSGYVQIRFNGKSYSAHRLAWFYVHGAWPKESIDHINNIRSDNRILNLREANQSENCQNLKKSRGASGFLGVSIDSVRGNRWKSAIKLNGKNYHLGWFKTAEQAHEVYLIAKRTMHPFGTL